MVKQGLIWRIGDGFSINVWFEPWLCEADTPFVQTQAVKNLEDLTVAHLIDQSSNCWDVGLI